MRKLFALGALLLLAANLAIAPQPLWAFLTCAALLLLAVNASYRAGGRRGAWRRYGELAGSFLIASLAFGGAHALNVRVAELGWTATFFIMSLIGTTRRPGVWPHFFGNSWSSSWMPEAPAAA